MPEQTINLPASAYTRTSASVKHWTLASGRPQIDSAFTDVARYFYQALFQGTRQVQVSLTSAASGADQSQQDLSSAFETTGTMRFELSTGEVLQLPMADFLDTSEPYGFNLAGTTYQSAYDTFFAALGTSGTEATTLKLSLPDPVSAPSFSPAAGAAQEWEVGKLITPITVPEAAGQPAPTYAVQGSLPAGLAFNANTRVISGTPTAHGSGTITIRASNSQGNADYTIAYTIALPLGKVYFGGAEYQAVYIGGNRLSLAGTRAGALAPTVPTPTHTVEFSIGNGGYNGPLGRGSVAAGSTFSYDTPAGLSVTIRHFRNVRGEVNFALSGATTGADADPNEFPSRIVVTKLTGGEVERTFTPQADSLRDIQGGVRQDYGPVSGATGDVFVNGQTVRAQLYY